MKIYNLPNRNQSERDANTFEIKGVSRHGEETHPIYNEVLKIFRHAFSYIDIGKILKNL